MDTPQDNWRERFVKVWEDVTSKQTGFVPYGFFYPVLSFIAKELERAQEEVRLSSGRVASFQNGFREGQASERARLREKIEGMKMKQRHVECENGKAETCDICFFTMSRNQVLSDLLDILKD